MKVKDLEFDYHPSGMGGARAVYMFPNGYGVSVVTGNQFYTNLNEPFEVGVLDENGITYKTPITDDVIGYQTEEGVNEIMEKVAALPPKEGA